MTTTSPSRPDSRADSDAEDLSNNNPLSLHRAVRARRSEYVRPRRTRIKIGSWNVAACPGTDKDLASWFVAGRGIDARLASLDPARHPAVVAREESTATFTSAFDEGRDALRLVAGDDDDAIGLYVLGLQEVVDLGPSQYLNRVVAEDPSKDRWKAALESNLPAGYRLVSCEQMSGLLLLIYASPDVFPSVSNVSTCFVGTGMMMGWIGNKGAVVTRIVLGETTKLVFVNAHLASGSDLVASDRRVWDVGQIASRSRFAPITFHGVSEDDGDTIDDSDFAFWFGDLNFRLEGLPGDDIRRLLTLHSRGEYGAAAKDDGGDEEEERKETTSLGADDRGPQPPSPTPPEDRSRTSSGQQQATVTDFDDPSLSLPDPDEFDDDPVPPPPASEDPASLQATLDSLLPHDQLRIMMRQRKVFHDGWREGPITFLPTYKYDVGTVSLFDSSDKKRSPSWCDRILYRSRSDRERYLQRLREEEETRRRDEEMKARGMEEAGEDDDVLFSYDPETDGDPAAASAAAAPPGGGGGRDGGAAEYDEYDDNDEREANHAGDDDAVVTADGSVDRIHLEIYTSHQRITSSDHKPLVALFTLEYDAVVPELKAKVHAEVARELDRAENEGRPVITVVIDGPPSGRDAGASDGAGAAADAPPDHAVDLGDVRFLEKKTATLTLANTGRVPATFSFVEKPAPEGSGSGSGGDGDAPSAPPWLRTTFVRPEHDDGGGGQDATEHSGGGGGGDGDDEVTLDPGETVRALVEVCVEDVAHARLLNSGQTTLDDVLVLRVVDGRDHFIPVRAAWQPTCVGRSLDELIRVPSGGGGGGGGGIRGLVASLLSSKSGGAHANAATSASVPYDRDVHVGAPRELIKLTDAVESLTERALADAQMLPSDQHQIPTDPGWPFQQTRRGDDDKDTAAARRRAQLVDVFEALDTDGRPLLEVLDPAAPSLERLETAAAALLLFLDALTDGVVPAALWARIEQASLRILGKPPSSARDNGRKNDGDGDGDDDDDRAAVLDVLAAAPHHNIAFVFLTATLAKIAGELSPLGRAELEVLRQNASSRSSGRRSISFRRGGAASSDVAEAQAALERRRAREKRFAEVFGRVVCRAPAPAREKERRALEERQKAVVELFLRRREES